MAILSTGNEVVEPGQPLAAGQIYDVNRFTLGAVVIGARRHRRSRTHRSRDTIDALDDALDAVRGTPTSSIFSGGSSVGERDLHRRS